MRGWREDAVRPRTERVAENAAALADRGLIVAMRCGDRGALAEFYRRFRPVLVVAVRRFTWGGTDDAPGAIDGEAVVEDVLTDAAIRFVTTTAAVPGSVAGYLVRMLRNRVLNAVRARDREARRVDEGMGRSEYAERTSAGPESADAGLMLSSSAAPAVVRLAAALDAAMTDDDRLVATWLGNGVSQLDIAEWLGVSHSALCKRVSRLRARLRLVANRHLAGASAEDRQVLDAVLGARGGAHE